MKTVTTAKTGSIGTTARPFFTNNHTGATFFASTPMQPAKNTSSLLSASVYKLITDRPSVSAVMVQRQCQGDVGNPPAYATAADASLRCDEANTGIADITQRLTNGRQRARVMIDDAMTVLSRIAQGVAEPAALEHFRRLFRIPAAQQPSLAQIASVRRIYTLICNWLLSDIATRGSGILCLTQGTGRCSGGRVLGSAACATRSATLQPINLCPDGISSDSQQTAETIIHEAAHRFGICTAPTVPERYEGEVHFPSAQPIRTSADSYNVFAREAHRVMGTERRRQSETAMPERPIRAPEPRRY